MTNDDLATIILPWAKEHRPEAYAKTMVPGVVNSPTVFRRYLTRLVELRYADDPASIRDLPISVLDETALAITMRDRPTGQVLVIKGALAPAPHEHRFVELSLDPAPWRSWLDAKAILELEHVE